jgi:hypothetical protein
MTKTIFALLGLIFSGLFLSFILINFMMGCEDWSNEQTCLTPNQIVEKFYE